MADETSGQPGAAPSPQPPVQTFSHEYVKELRQESAGYRLRASEAEKKANEAAEASKKAADEAAERVKKAEEAAQARIIRAEIKAHAIKAGIVDVDGLALADLSKLTLNDKGDVVGAEEAIDALRKAKPYLFAKTTSSSGKPGEGQPPTRGEPKQKRATEMTAEEYQAFKRSKGLK